MKNPLGKKYSIIIAIVVWVAAAIPFIKIFFPSQNAGNNVLPATILSEQIISDSRDTFTLVNNYGDPFLKRNIVPKKTTSSSAPKKIEKKAPPPIQVTAWPSVSYSGQITSKQSSKQIGIFTINGREALLSPQQQQEGIVLLKLFNDSALVEFNKEKRYLKK